MAHQTPSPRAPHGDHAGDQRLTRLTGDADATAAQIHPTTTPTPEPTTTPDPPTSIAPRLVEDTPGERAFSYALLLEKHGDEQGAIAAYERADRLGHPAAATNLGILLEHQGQHAAAEAAYRRAEQRGDPDGAFNLALLLGERGEHTAALHAFQRARTGSDTPPPRPTSACCSNTKADHAAAEAAYRRAEQRGDPHGAFNLALLLGEQQDHAGALRAYQRADQLGHPAAATNLGVLLEHQGQHAAAEAAYRARRGARRRRTARSTSPSCSKPAATTKAPNTPTNAPKHSDTPKSRKWPAPPRPNWANTSAQRKPEVATMPANSDPNTANRGSPPRRMWVARHLLVLGAIGLGSVLVPASASAHSPRHRARATGQVLESAVPTEAQLSRVVLLAPGSGSTLHGSAFVRALQLRLTAVNAAPGRSTDATGR